MTEETGWRQKLEALRERPKPLILQPKKSQLLPYGASPCSPVPKAYSHTASKKPDKVTGKYSSRHSARSRSPDVSTDCAPGGDSRRRSTRHESKDAAGAATVGGCGGGHVKVLNVSDQKECSHLLAVLNVANQKESLRHVTSTGSYMLDSPEVVPECLNTFSDFYNPSISADERFEKYLAEMHRREKEVEKDERLKLRNTSIGSFHYGKYGKKRKPFAVSSRKLPSRSGMSRAIAGDFNYENDAHLGGQPHSKKPLAISTFSLLDIDKMRHKDGFGLPHTTR